MALGTSDVVAFVATEDTHRARAFYEKMLGLTLVAEDPHALIFDAHGTTMRVVKVDTLVPAAHTVLGWRVPDVEAAVSDLQSRGVLFERYPGLPQDERGICTFPGGGRVAWFRDPDGNVLSVSD